MYRLVAGEEGRVGVGRWNLMEVDFIGFRNRWSVKVGKKEIFILREK